MRTAISKYRRVIRYTMRQWPSLVLILGLTVAIAATAALQPWPLKLLVDHALGGAPAPLLIGSLLERFSLSPTPTTLIFLAAVSSLGLFLLSSALDAGLNFAWASAGQRMIYDLASHLFQRLQRVSLLFHSQRTVGDMLSRLMGDSWCVYTVTDSLLISPLQHVLTLATIGAIAWNLDAKLTLYSLIIAPVLGGSAFFFGHRLKQRTLQNREAQSRLLSFVHQTLVALPIVQAFGTEERNRYHFRILAKDAVVHLQHSALLKNAQLLVNGLTITMGTAIVLYIGGGQVLSGTLPVGSFLVFLAYQTSMQNAIQGLLVSYVNLKMAESNIDRVLEVSEAKDEVVDRPGAKPLPARSAVRQGAVRFENISFGYLPGCPVLKEISLEGRPGEAIAVVGPTGAGKSTLVSLIPRFFDPWEGRVTFNGIDVRDIKLASLREQTSIVLQEPFLLPVTVAENIAYGRPGASGAQIVAAARAANADAFIRRLPQGYDTIIGERGATFSGGEKQRLAIARALLKDAPILILDEPTSALDAQTETLLIEALERLMKGRTTFIIAHRLSTIRRANRIVVLENGKIVESGTHQELLAANGSYHRLHSLQFPTLPQEVVR
jgi:ATP-binding cassette subfamily B protein